MNKTTKIAYENIASIEERGERAYWLLSALDMIGGMMEESRGGKVADYDMNDTGSAIRAVACAARTEVSAILGGEEVTED